MKLLFVFLFMLSCSGGEKTLQTIEGKTMGTYYRVKLYSNDKPENLKEDIDKFFKLFNDLYSTYIPSSEVSKINSSKFDNMKISDSMKKVLEISQEVSRKSKGYFDITVGPLVNLWGFGPDGKQNLPSTEEVAAARKLIGFEKVEVKDGRLHRPVGTYLDFSAVAKGFGVDEVIKFLEYQGYQNLLVEVGGEVRARGKKADGSKWKVGVEGPSEELGAKLVKVLELDNMAMATSGNYRNYLKYGDKIFSHTINPLEGRPAEHKTISVTVVHEYCADADAWATAFMSMGHEMGLEMANNNEIIAFFQVKEGNDIKYFSSRKFERMFGK